MKYLVLLGAVLAGALAQARTEPNSFLNRPAPTLKSLLSQVRTDPEVLSRFERHFGWNRQQVLSFMSSLRQGVLAQDGVYLVYNCNDQEEIGAKVIFYKKGTRVWLNPKNEPIMKVSCANPMVRGSDDQLTEPQLVSEATDELKPVQALVEGAPEGEPEAAMFAVDQELEAQALPGAAIAGLVPSVGGGFFSPLWLAPLGLGFIRTGGHDDNPPPPPVPEPTTMILAAGGAAFLLRRRKKQS